MSRKGSKGGGPFESVFRVYHEVEDVGKTVRASKRRARWTFIFGEGGEEKEVILIHSVVSGKKTVMYNGSEIAHSNEMSRSYSYTWHIGDHVLRLDIFDIVEVGTQVAKGSAEKMYELTIDGVPFSLLQPHNPYPPRRPGISKDSGGARQASTRKFPDSEDDFNPRGSSTTVSSSASKPKATIVAPPKPVQSAPVTDLLSMPATNDAPASFADSFDPFSKGATFAPSLAQTTGGFGGAFPPPSSATFDAFGQSDAFGGGGGTGFGGGTDFSKGFSGALTVAQIPAKASIGATQDFSPFQAAPDSPGSPDVDKVTPKLVNLNNLMDDTPSAGDQAKVYKPSVYTDNRSLDDLKASAPKNTPAKPAFIERPPMLGPPRQPSMNGGFPPNGPIRQPSGGFGGPPPFPGFPGPAQPPNAFGFQGPPPPRPNVNPATGLGPSPVMGMGGPPPPHMGFGARPMNTLGLQPIQANPFANPNTGLGPTPTPGTWGGPRPAIQIRPPPDSNDPFAGLGRF